MNISSKPSLAKKILVLGGRGFIGAAIAKEASASGYAVHIGSRRASAGGHHRLPLHQHTRAEDWTAAIEGYVAVVNAVGILRPRWRESYEQIHTLAPRALARACAVQDIPLLHISALGLQANSSSRFLRSKVAGERGIIAAQGRSVIVRVPLLDGDGGFGARWFRRVANWPVWFLPKTFGAKLQPMPVSELAKVIVGLVNKRHSLGRAAMLEVGGAERFSLVDYLRRLRDPRRADPRIVYLPNVLSRFAAHCCDVLHVTPYSWGHLELLRRDNVARRNGFAAAVGREPRVVSRSAPDGSGRILGGSRSPKFDWRRARPHAKSRDSNQPLVRSNSEHSILPHGDA